MCSPGAKWERTLDPTRGVVNRSATVFRRRGPGCCNVDNSRSLFAAAYSEQQRVPKLQGEQLFPELSQSCQCVNSRCGADRVSGFVRRLKELRRCMATDQLWRR